MRQRLNTKERLNKEIRSWMRIIILAFIIALIINKGIIVNAYVPTSSMENTIMVGDRVVANRLAYTSNDPVRGDIIVFKCPDDKSMLYVKRIIGLPGDEVEIKNNNLYINGVILEEDYLLEEIVGEFGPYRVPDNYYFMLGDNRNRSKDSRMWHNTYLHKDDIVGKVILRYFPNIKTYN